MMDLRLGDCLELMKDIPDNSIDCCITDPPYGITKLRWDNIIDFELMWEQLKRIVKDNGAICLFGSEPFSSALRMSNIKMFKYDWIWEKDRAPNFALSKYRPLSYHEIISVFYSKTAKYYPQKIKRDSKRVEHCQKNKNSSWKTIRKSEEVSFQTQYTGRSFYVYDAGLKFPSSVVKNPIVNPGSKEKKQGRHPTQKPIKLLEYLIKTYSLENETILDFTMGSGSTAIACLNTNRKFIGIEKDETYFNIAKERIEKHNIK